MHDFDFWSMAGTYLDFPGHILETDTGIDAATVPIERVFRIPSQVVKLDRPDGSGAVKAEDLARACPKGCSAPGLIVNALGRRRFDEIAERSVYLSRDAVRWIVERGTTLLVSDIYESAAVPQDVFRTLFRADIMTVCCPERLAVIQADEARVTALPIRCRDATQIPCRLVVEEV